MLKTFVMVLIYLYFVSYEIIVRFVYAYVGNANLRHSSGETNGIGGQLDDKIGHATPHIPPVCHLHLTLFSDEQETPIPRTHQLKNRCRFPIPVRTFSYLKREKKEKKEKD